LFQALHLRTKNKLLGVIDLFEGVFDLLLDGRELRLKIEEWDFHAHGDAFLPI